MTPDDLARLHAACFRTPPPWDGVAFASLLASPAVFVETSPTGFILGRVTADEAEVLTLAVDPAARRNGTGRDLLARFVAQAQARGAVTAFLEVAADNDAAVALYAGSGFVESGRRRGYYRQPDGRRVDALVLSTSIPLVENPPKTR